MFFLCYDLGIGHSVAVKTGHCHSITALSHIHLVLVDLAYRVKFRVNTMFIASSYVSCKVAFSSVSMMLIHILFFLQMPLLLQLM